MVATPGVEPGPSRLQRDARHQRELDGRGGGWRSRTASSSLIPLAVGRRHHADCILRGGTGGEARTLRCEIWSLACALRPRV